MSDSVVLRPGLQVVAVPEVSGHSYYATINSLKETLTAHNEFVAQIVAQGGEIITAYNEQVVRPERAGVIGREIDERTFFVVWVR